LSIIAACRKKYEIISHVEKSNEGRQTSFPAVESYHHAGPILTTPLSPRIGRCWRSLHLDRSMRSTASALRSLSTMGATSISISPSINTDPTPLACVCREEEKVDEWSDHRRDIESWLWDLYGAREGAGKISPKQWRPCMSLPWSS
jgi:hypothetical protein